MKLTTYFCRLRDFRLATGLTQSELASLVGCSKNTISSIEREEFRPSLDLALRLSDALSVPLRLLFHFSYEVL